MEMALEAANREGVMTTLRVVPLVGLLFVVNFSLAASFTLLKVRRVLC